MSEDESREALVEALSQHVRISADGAYLTDYVITAAGAMPDDPDATTYVTEASDGPLHHRLGLIRYLALRAEELVMDDDE